MIASMPHRFDPLPQPPALDIKGVLGPYAILKCLSRHLELSIFLEKYCSLFPSNIPRVCGCTVKH